MAEQHHKPSHGDGGAARDWRAWGDAVVAAVVLAGAWYAGGGWGTLLAIPLVACVVIAAQVRAGRQRQAIDAQLAAAAQAIGLLEKRLERLADERWERKENEELHHTLSEAHGDLIIHRDRDGLVTFVNQTFSESLGVAPGEVVGKPLALDLTETLEADGMAIDRRGVTTRDVRIRTRDGERWFAWSDIPARDADGRLGPIQSVARDITTRKETERVLREARMKAEAANEAKSRVLATVSHEIRTPLNGILGLVGLLLETRLSAEQETFARAVRGSGELLLGLIDDMLDFAKIEAGRLDLNQEPCRLEDLAQDIVELLAARAHGKGLDLAAYVAPDLPETVGTDPARLRQVLINLVGNGIKFTETGGVTLKIETLPDAEAGCVLIGFSVEDSGPGIAPEDSERIFAEFERARTDGGGAGLGLAISRRIVRRMGGDITAERRAAGGSVFRFSLQLAIEAPAAAAAPPLAGRRILLVMPEGTEPPVVVRLLTDAGAEVRHATRPMEASALAAAAAAAGMAYDSLLVDRRAAADPGDLLAQLRQAGGTRLPAAVLIDPGSRRQVNRLKSQGFDAYLVRPLRRASLIGIAGHLAAPGSSFEIDPGDRKPRPATATQRRRRTLDVLVVEDDEINVLLVRAVLERLGHGVTEVRDSKSAIATATSAQFDAVLLDLNLPDGDGFETARAIRAHEADMSTPRVTIVAVTADARPETRLRATEAGCDQVLVKPVDPEQLRQMLGAVKPAIAA